MNEYQSADVMAGRTTNNDPIRPLRIGEPKTFTVAALENVAAGVCASAAMVAAQLAIHGDVVSLPMVAAAGLAATGVLGLYRWGSDEAGACYASVRNKFDAAGYVRDIQELIRECEDKDRQIAALQQRLARAAGKEQRQRVEPESWTRQVADRGWDGTDIYQDDELEEWFASHGAGIAEVDTAPDDDTIADAEAAHALLNHHASYGTMSKHSAYDRSNISHNDWRRGIDFLVACGAVGKDGKAYSLRVEDESAADALIDQFVQARMDKKQQTGLHTVA